MAMSTALSHPGGHRKPPAWIGPLPLGPELRQIRATAGHAPELVAKLALVLPVAFLAAVESCTAENRYRSERERIALVLGELAGEKT
jgi:hypothetical protein